MFALPDHIQLRERIKAGEILDPRLILHRMIDGPGQTWPPPISTLVETPAETQPTAPILLRERHSYLLVTRGLNGVEWTISDPHGGLQAARQAVFSGISWQRSRFHFRQPASQYGLRLGMKRKVAADIHRTHMNPFRLI
jgi:hypothetical protein